MDLGPVFGKSLFYLVMETKYPNKLCVTICVIFSYTSLFFKYISPKHKPVLEIKQLIIYHQSQEKLHNFWFTMADCQEV